jgi:hypothetical protein
MPTPNQIWGTDATATFTEAEGAVSRCDSPLGTGGPFVAPQRTSLTKWIDVPGSFKWYQALFGQPATLPAHDYFGQILDSDGTVLLCLHE